METFSVFDPLHAGSLNVISTGVLSGTFILADEIRNYADIGYTPKLQSIAKISTTLHRWTLYPGKNFFSRDIFINDDATNNQAAVVKTSLWLARISIHFDDGQIFNFKRPTVFSKTQRWYNSQYGDVLTTEATIFTIRPKLQVIPGQSTFKNNDQLLLMIFIAFHMIYMRKVRAGYVDDK